MNAIDPHTLCAAIDALVDDRSSARFGVAVSGGPDSMALLDLAATSLAGRVEAATVDHGLRAEAAAEAAMVARFCAERALPHRVLYPTDAPIGNVQDWARTERYAQLDAWRAERGIDWLLTAHHADDQLETMLMRLNRGAGVGGLAGIRSRTGFILRPLLGLRKAALIAHVETAGIPHVEDPSNRDSRYERAALRLALANADWLRPEAAAHSGTALEQAEAALDWTAAMLARDHVRPDDHGWTLDRPDVPAELQRRLLRIMLESAGQTAPRGPSMDRLLIGARTGRQSSIGPWLLLGGEQWRLRPAPPRR